MKLIANYSNQINMVSIYLLCINIISFITFGIDKRRAKNKKWRMSENSLLLISFIGGAAGALIGMVIFSHKLSKRKFYIGIPILIVLNMIGIFYILNYIK